MYVDYDLPPLFSQSTYTWIFGENSLPADIAVLHATSEVGHVGFRLGEIHRSPYSAHDLGLALDATEGILSVSADFATFTVLALPITGVIQVFDNRTTCNLLTGLVQGPCIRNVTFSLSLTNFKPSCPQDIFKYTFEPSAVVTWITPRLFHARGTEIGLRSTKVSGSVFTQGVHTVTYTPAATADASQFGETTPMCTFRVSSKL